MSHSLSKVWLHVIFSTKDRLNLISQEAERDIYNLMRKELEEMGCEVKSINGMADHVHLLFLLNPSKSIAEILKQLKGASSHAINANNLTKDKFSWQTGYSSFGVSESVVDKVHQYIVNQKKHHERKTFQEEYDEFIRLYKLEASN